LLLEELFDAPPPGGGVAEEIHGDSKARRLALLALDALAGGGEAEISSRPFFEDRIRLSHFLFDDGWRFISAEWRRQFVSIDDSMRLRLSPRMSFLYGLLRAPLWLWRRLARLASSRA
jgi:hypothetical protein